MIGTILMAIIGGAIIGWLGKVVVPGKVRIPLWLTIACGIGGIFVGTFLYAAVWGNANTPGIDWWRHAWQVVVAAILVSAAASVRTSKATRV